jgi:integron integrase
MEPRPKRLLDQVRAAIRLKHYAYRTEATYGQWLRRYILFHNKRHPNERGAAEIEAFLTHLAVQEQVAAATQNQALNAILFLYRAVLKLEVSDVNAIRAKRTESIPTVLTPAEARDVIQNICGVQQLVMKLLYGGGLRLCEGLRLRIKDIDFAQPQIIVRDGKGSKSRVTMLPSSVADELRDHLMSVKRQHQQDLGRGFGAVSLLYALDRKYPNANREWIWQFVFPSITNEVSEVTNEVSEITNEVSEITNEVANSINGFSEITIAIANSTNEFSEITNEFSEITIAIAKTTNEFSETTNAIAKATNGFSEITIAIAKATNESSEITIAIAKVTSAVQANKAHKLLTSADLRLCCVQVSFMLSDTGFPTCPTRRNPVCPGLR